MIPVVAQIELIASVHPAVVHAGPSRRAPAAGQPDVSAQSAEKAAKVVEAPRPPAPVLNAQALRLTVEPETHEVIATLVNKETNEVIRQIPAEEMNRAAEVIRAITGQLIDQMV
jgi:flagellar protein FlaG